MRPHIVLAWIILAISVWSMSGYWWFATLIAMWLLGFRITEDRMHISDAELYRWLNLA